MSELDLGATIRARRRAQALTLVQLAELTGLSNPFLSQVERGRAHPSMASLHRIAAGLQTTIPELMSESADARGAEDHPHDAPSEPAPSEDVCLVRADDDALVHEHDKGRTRALVRGARSLYPLEFWITSAEYEDYFAHRGAEFIYLLSGALTVDLDTEGVHDLSADDSLYVPGGVRHRWRTRGSWPARALVVQARAAEPGTGPGDH